MKETNKHSKILTLALRLILFLLIVLTFDQVIGRFLHYLYYNQRSGQDYLLTYVLKDVKTDILVIGNSRAQHHYCSQILTDSLNMSCFNGGLDGGHSVLLPFGQLEVILRRYTPKIIILEYDPSDYYYNVGDYEKLSIFLPYTREYPELFQLALFRSPYERLKMISAIYPFNSNLLNMIRFNSNLGRKIDFNGYVPILNRQMDSTLYNAFQKKHALKDKSNTPADTTKIYALKRIVQLCKEKGARLVIVNSPYFHPSNKNSIFKLDYNNEALTYMSEENVEFYDFKFDSRFKGRMDLFSDVSHLNDSGAKIFTACLAATIKTNNVDKVAN